jgi:hypothetical protein
MRAKRQESDTDIEGRETEKIILISKEQLVSQTKRKESKRDIGRRMHNILDRNEKESSHERYTKTKDKGNFDSSLFFEIELRYEKELRRVSPSEKTTGCCFLFGFSRSFFS